MLQDGEIDHRQHNGIHSNTLHMNVKRGPHWWEKANIDTVVITEGNVAQTAVWAVYEIVQFECLLPAVGCPPTNVYLYFDCPQLRILSVMNLKELLLKYTIQRQLNTTYSITVLQ